MQKIAELFYIRVTELLDDFNLFLYSGQGQQIKELRRHRNMTQAEFARWFGVPLGTPKEWEQNRVQILKSTWEKQSAKTAKVLYPTCACKMKVDTHKKVWVSTFCCIMEKEEGSERNG